LSNYLQTGPFGSELHAHDYVADGVAVVPTEAVRGRQIDHSVLPRITPAKAKSLERHRLKAGDILFARRGVQATGHIGYVREPEEGFICGTGAIRLRIQLGNSEVEPEFLSHVLANPASVAWFKFHAIGATMPNLNEGIIRAFPLKLPPLPEQRAIAYILGTLDDKIELNRRMNETLEAMARALFQSWFVDFDPVRAKAEGRDPGLPTPIADLFPARLLDSELGEIPEGWWVRPFSAMVEIIGGGTPKTSISEYWGGGIPWFSAADAPSENDVFVISTEKSITQEGLENSAAHLLPEGTTIISARGTVGKLALVGVPMTMNQSCYGLRGIEAGSNFTYYATRNLISILKQRSHGSVFDMITRDRLAGVNFIAPPKATLEAFEQVVESFMQRIKSNLTESRTLAALRDALLPMLISGEIQVKDAEKFLEEAGQC
jgi:type I restriction enzyme, S subunit